MRHSSKPSSVRFLLCCLAGLSIMTASSRGSGIGVQQLGKFYPNDPAVDDYFGLSIALDGNRAIVGANGNDDIGKDSGSAYIFENVGGTWTQTALLHAWDGGSYDSFGSGVSIDGNTAVVGAYSDNNSVGSAYVFEYDGNAWSPSSKLTASGPSAVRNFGASASIDGDVLFVGSHADDNARGSVYVFERIGGTWTQTAQLQASDTSDIRFGRGVAVEGNLALIGATNDDLGATDAGAIYVFQKIGGTWQEMGTFRASDPAAGDLFGAAVALDGDFALVTASWDDDAGTNSGSVYAFQNIGGNWTEVTKFQGLDTTSNDNFGLGVALDGEAALAGCYRDWDNGKYTGSAYHFEITGRNVVPEPATLLAGLAGLAGIGQYLRRRK